MADWCDLATDDPSTLFEPVPIPPGAKLPFEYGRVWQHAGSWIDPWTRTVHLED